MVLSSQNPLAQNWYMLIAQGLVFSVIYYVIFTSCIKMFNLKTPGREAIQDDTVVTTTSNQTASRREKAQLFIAALGGKDNISNIDACITRLRLVLVDRSKINEQQLKALGSKGNVKLGDNALQVILGPEAEIIADEMKTL